MAVIAIAIVARNGVLGDGEAQPFEFAEDWARYKRVTLGHPMIMGRKTFDSIGRPLPGRRTIVITRNPTWQHPGVETAHSFTDALSLAGPADEVFAAGGAQIYELALPFAQRLVITEVDAEPEGDTWFPSWARADWVEVSREAHDGWSRVVHERV